jgi:phosphodiesterase/alkaline phosphatase D-like protein
MLRDTTVHFEYGKTKAYGSVTTESGSIGSDEAQHLTGAKLSGLTPSTTYHFRAVATNALGSTVSTDGVFTTQPALFVAPSPVVKRKKCKRGFVKRHGRCVKKRHRRHHHSSSDRTHRQG